jgi:hypothetical protein
MLYQKIFPPYVSCYFKKISIIFKSPLAIVFFFCYSSQFNYGGSIGPHATIDCEPRQARKGAAVTIDSGAEVWLLELPPKL